MQTAVNAPLSPVDPGAASMRPLGSEGAAPIAARQAGVSVQKPQPKAEPAFDAEAMRKNLQAAIEQLNKQLADSGRNLGFSMDDVLNRPVVKVTNTQTGELVRQIPSDAVIKVAHTLEELKGLLYDATT